MATVVDYLGAGHEVLQSDIVSNRFPVAMRVILKEA